MEEVNPLKESIFHGTLNIGLPTLDIYSDIALSTKLYLNKQNIWAISIFVPFLVNYALGWRAWIYTERKKNRKWTWIFVLIGCYPQMLIARIIWLFWKRSEEGVRQKEHFERNVMENEIYTEAVPTSLVMTLIAAALNQQSYTEDETTLFLGGKRSMDRTLFWVTFSTSVLSAGLGLAKSLKVGS